VAAAAAAMNRVAEIRRSRISGRMDNHERKVGDDWVVEAQGEAMALKIRADRGGATVDFADGGSAMRVESDWVPGQPLAGFWSTARPWCSRWAASPAATGSGCAARI
jgi:propionyl-CoA carboxylase alpha chain